MQKTENTPAVWEKRKIMNEKNKNGTKSETHFMERDIVELTEAFSKAWRAWHLDTSQFPSDELIDSAHKLDELFPGHKEFFNDL